MGRPKGIKKKVLSTKAPLTIAEQFEALAARRGQTPSTRILWLITGDLAHNTAHQNTKHSADMRETDHIPREPITIPGPNGPVYTEDPIEQITAPVADVTFDTPITGKSTGHRHRPGQEVSRKTVNGETMVQYECAVEGCGAKLPWRKAT